MNQSFYTKQGLDFLYFSRPGTAYGSQAFQQAMGKTAFGTATMSGFYGSDQKTIKPVEMIKTKTQSSLVTQLWFERAKKVM